MIEETSEQAEQVEPAEQAEQVQQVEVPEADGARLRRKIEADPKLPRFLQTVRGQGYVLRPG